MTNAAPILNSEMKAAVMRMVGIALLWVGLAAMIYVPSSGGGAKGSIVAVLGFLSFAAGCSLLVDALKAQIIRQIQRKQPNQ